MGYILNEKLLRRCGVIITALIFFYGCNVTGVDEKNGLPIADPGIDRTVGIGNQILLDGSGSSDAVMQMVIP